ncbi:TatD family hydrolase [Thalassotalea sp. M1531]|uniref:TatD family hydrolase n=1 Tax=Thalassotalea algicola TaxID=2716224 RepID=A0A7Y0LF15_9GAMM|nr:TatD family hydrolase [Thalassotalea algicola]NMP31960.1 TatD family hydrolase [Thalassotalea algicola]
MHTFTDSHCHLDFQELSSNIDVVLAECLRNNIKRIIVPSVGPQNWTKVLALTSVKSDISIYPCLGIHPWYLDDISIDSINLLDELLSTHKSELIALGEAGIDGTIAKEKQNLTKQIEIFELQLMLANKHQLPVIVHHRRSHPETVKCLKEAKLKSGGIIHAFSGSYQQAKHYLDLGFKLGIGGTITYPRAEKTIKTVKKLPIDCLVLETDAPSMPLAGYQGHPNHPKRIINVFEHLLAIREESAEQLAMQMEENINQLFELTR